ncbi:hypothetical protein FB45DRAFT_923648 [Roridomyces roridus]|uniref:MYND-type domain-containing protein n=1 Tax=Roridomyces roridus TaxID=1738132 RepID=A0AAD7FK21_9AGAR|nr:hypothetical protein FB45DRAFT_923648 [Roridomyces roridus]
MTQPEFKFGGVFHTVHPEIKKYHKSYLTSPKDMREVKAQRKQACAVCGNIQNEIRRCGKCKHASYCSKECQKADWPTHKVACSPTDSGLNMQRVVQNLDASTFLNMQIQAAFILAFDLLRDPRINQMFAVRMDVGVEPTDLMKFLKIYHGRADAPIPDNLEGMVQINAFTPLPLGWDLEAAKRSWASGRARAIDGGFGDAPVGLMVISKANALVQMHPIMVFPQMMEMMRNSPTFEATSTLTGVKKSIPVDINGLMEMMNKHIRADDKNTLAMRTEMTAGDVQVIRDAAKGNVLTSRPPNWAVVAPSPKLAATILREKVERDAMYKPHIVIC